MKCNFDFSSDRRGIGGSQLSLVGVSERGVHVAVQTEWLPPTR
jgi:hypothetical protein